MRNRIYILFSLVLISFSCNKEKVFDGPNFYRDGFEEYNFSEDLLAAGDSRWNRTSLTNSENKIEIDTTNAIVGNKCLKFFGKKTGEKKEVSKCSIAKQKMIFWDGETVRASAKYYIQGNESAEWLFLMDLEEQTPIGAGPGLRVALANNMLCIEHKFNEPDLYQADSTGIKFPRNQWVEIIWEIKLSQKHKGYIKLWQDGTLVIDSANERTLPKDMLYFLQGTKGGYNSIEIGITANSYDNDMILYVDDFSIETLN